MRGQTLRSDARVVCIDGQELSLTDMTFHLPPDFVPPLIYIRNTHTVHLHNVLIFGRNFANKSALIDCKGVEVFDTQRVHVYDAEKDSLLGFTFEVNPFAATLSLAVMVVVSIMFCL
jgi:hypothetical protein